MFNAIISFYKIIHLFSLPSLEVATSIREGTLVCGALHIELVFFSQYIVFSASLDRWEAFNVYNTRVQRPQGDRIREGSAGFALLGLYHLPSQSGITSHRI